MKYDLAEEQRLLRESIREFVEHEIIPHAGEWDKQHRFPSEVIQKCAEMGLAGVMVPKELGGAGLTTLDYVIATEEISRGCASTGVILSVNNSLVLDPLMRFGNEAQKQKYIPPLASGEQLGCFGLTEPAAGSDAGSQKTVYREEDDCFLINGTKNFITNGPQADVCILFASKDPSLGNKGLTAFITESGFAGFNRGKAENKMGICASGTSTITVDNLRVPKENRLGAEGEGFKIAMSTLDGGRIGIAAQAVGIAQAALEAAQSYAGERVQFGRPIASFQGLRWMLADMAVTVDAARLLTWKAAVVRDRGERYTFEASQAKLFASETANRVADRAVQIHGGYGYIKEYPVERFFRDAKITGIYEGTSEIQRLVVAQKILKDHSLVCNA